MTLLATFLNPSAPWSAYIKNIECSELTNVKFIKNKYTEMFYFWCFNIQVLNQLSSLIARVRIFSLYNDIAWFVRIYPVLLIYQTFDRQSDALTKGSRCEFLTWFIPQNNLLTQIPSFLRIYLYYEIFTNGNFQWPLFEVSERLKLLQCLYLPFLNTL